MSYTLPDLPFDSTQLSPFNSKQTFEYHHGKHHAGYVTKLNNAIKNTPYSEMNLENVILKAYQENNKAVFNNAAQHFNHSFFWNCLSPNSKEIPEETLDELINIEFGSFDNFKDKFTTAANTLFGSGWIWLTISNNKLEILQMKDADNPIIINKTPILTLDIWEHAYYIDHKNERTNFINEFWKVINWNFCLSNI